VEAHVSKPQFVVAAAQLRLVIRAQRHRRVVAAHSMLPEMRKRSSLRRQIAVKVRFTRLERAAIPYFQGRRITADSIPVRAHRFTSGTLA